MISDVLESGIMDKNVTMLKKYKNKISLKYT